MTAFKKLLVPTDFSSTAAEAFRVAISLVRLSGGELVVAHVTRDLAVVTEHGVAMTDAASAGTNEWDRFRDAETPNVKVTHELVAAGQIPAKTLVG